MNIEGVYRLLQEVGLPVAYRSWVGQDGGTPPDRPYLIYYFEDTDPFPADDSVYITQNSWCVELYVDHKNPSIEIAIEELLSSKEILFAKHEVGPVADAAPLLITYRFQTI